VTTPNADDLGPLAGLVGTWEGGLDYRMAAWRGDEEDPFHTEVGSETYGIPSNLYLSSAARSTR